MMMIKKYMLATSIFLMMLGAFSLSAQKVEFYTYQLKQTTKLKAGKIFFIPLRNTGKESSIDVNSYILDEIAKWFQPIGTENTTDQIVWTKKAWFSKAENATEAAVIVSGHYNIQAATEVEQYQFYETSGLISNPIPYFEVRPKNIVNAEVIISYQYADKTMDYDTIQYSDVSERKSGRKMKGLANMVESCSNSIKSKVRNIFNWIDMEKANYQLEKVKISDKALKEEFKQAGDLLKNHEIMKLGNLCKRIYENSPSKEAAYNLGVCYELVGNYPKATALYKQMPEFHTIARMKKSLLLFDYIHELGVETELAEF